MLHKTGTVKEIRKALPDVPSASLYRHIKILTDSTILMVVGENRIRGTVESVYQLNKDAMETRICYYLQTARCYWLTRSFQVFLRKSIRLRSSTWKKRQWKAAKHDRLRSSLPHRMSRWWLWKSKGNGCYAHIVTGKPVCGCEEILFFGIIFFSVQSASRKHSLIYDNFI